MSELDRIHGWNKASNVIEDAGFFLFATHSLDVAGSQSWCPSRDSNAVLFTLNAFGWPLTCVTGMNLNLICKRLNYLVDKSKIGGIHILDSTTSHVPSILY